MTQEALVTILIPNYKTLDLTKLCLRLIRKRTDFKKAKVIVIDNDSQDESTDYLRSLKWIKLIERSAEPDDIPHTSHSRALDLGLKEVDTPYVLIIHTDTLVKHEKWLDFLLHHIEKKPNVAGVGSWKLEQKPWYRRAAKALEEKVQLWWYKLINKKDHNVQGVGKNYYYLRSHCALYRMSYLKQYGLTFSEDQDTAGKVMHRKLIENDHDMIFIPSEKLCYYMDHVNHATMVLNPELGSRKKSIVKGKDRIKRSLKKIKADEILADNGLDI